MTALAGSPGLRALLPEEALAIFTRRRDVRLVAAPFELCDATLWFHPYSTEPLPIARWVGGRLLVRDLPQDAFLLGWQLWTPQDALGRLESYHPRLQRIPGPLTPYRTLKAMFQSYAFAGAGPVPTASGPAWGTLEWKAFSAWLRLKALWRRWFGGGQS